MRLAAAVRAALRDVLMGLPAIAGVGIEVDSGHVAISQSYGQVKAAIGIWLQNPAKRRENYRAKSVR
jgi:hypothetical protein